MAQSFARTLPQQVLQINRGSKGSRTSRSFSKGPFFVEYTTSWQFEKSICRCRRTEEDAARVRKYFPWPVGHLSSHFGQKGRKFLHVSSAQRERKRSAERSSAGTPTQAAQRPPPLESPTLEDSLGSESASGPSREQVLQACIFTSLGIGAAGLGLRTAFHAAAGAGLPLNDCSELLPLNFDLGDVVPALAIIGGVSLARWLLLSTWSEFQSSSDSSNQQLLAPLDLPDVFVLGLLPGLGEELLFRGFLLPAVSPDWKGAVVAGAVFGVLHITGGRKVAFGAWASAVGIVYGLGAVYTQNLAVPIVAHVVNNVVVGLHWKLQNPQKLSQPASNSKKDSEA